MSLFQNEEHMLWVNEVKDLYKKVKLHKVPYNINFIDSYISIFPNVFSPKYFNNTRWYSTVLPNIIGGKKLLEIGTGTGAIAIQCYKNGAAVTATDINVSAYNCAMENFKNNNCKIITYLGDIFDPVPIGSKFDFIFWNHPYNNSAELIEDELLIAGFDYKYNNLKKYIANASNFLTDPNVGLLLGTGGQADIESIGKIAKENDYEMGLLELIKMPLGENTKAPNDFRIYEFFKETKHVKR